MRSLLSLMLAFVMALVLASAVSSPVRAQGAKAPPPKAAPAAVMNTSQHFCQAH